MNVLKIISVVGARPNFMKIAPFIHAINKHNKQENNIQHLLVHTGQHYDDRMSKTFFEALNIPEADINLGIGSGTHAEQVGNTMIAFEKVLIEHKPDWVVVVGDVNATLACSVTAKKLHIKVAHIEAGLRSGDMTMPEEINRLVTDRLSDLLLTPDTLSIKNLEKEGVNADKIKFVGNIMIDTLDSNIEKAESLDIINILKDNIHEKSNFSKYNPQQPYAVVTMHRPSNVDDKTILTSIINFLCDEVTHDMQIIWPVHPRTFKMLITFDLLSKVIASTKFILLNPIGYHEMLKLNKEATVMLTDSGGLQEECTVLGTPCLTLRWNTERPVTLVEHGGASYLVGNAITNIRNAYKDILTKKRTPTRPELWDGRTAQRCLDEIIKAS